MYLGAIALITILTSGVLLPAAGDASGWRFAIYVAAVVLATSQLAVALVNWFATLLVAPRAAADGFLDGHSADLAHAGGRSDVSNHDRGHRRPGRETRVRFLANRD